MAVFLINICKFNGCGITFPSLGDLIQHIEDTHIDYDPQVIEQKEQSRPACLPLSYVLRFITDAARKEGPFLGTSGAELKRKLAIKHHSYSMSSSNRSNTPTDMGSEMDEDEMMVSESEDSNDSWTTEEFSSEFIMRYGSRHSGPVGNSTTNEKPFACPVPGCKKRYKNVNGIKYHSKNGHKKDGKVRKGYKCHCGKSYKTSQGLKNHSLMAHNAANGANNGSGGNDAHSQSQQQPLLPTSSSSPPSVTGSLSPSSASNASGGSNHSGTHHQQPQPTQQLHQQLHPHNQHSQHNNINNSTNNQSSSQLSPNSNSISSSAAGGGGVVVVSNHTNNGNNHLHPLHHSNHHNNNNNHHHTTSSSSSSSSSNGSSSSASATATSAAAAKNNFGLITMKASKGSSAHKTGDSNGVKQNLPSLVNLGILTPATSPKHQQAPPTPHTPSNNGGVHPLHQHQQQQLHAAVGEHLLPLTPISPNMSKSLQFTSNASGGGGGGGGNANAHSIHNNNHIIHCNNNNSNTTTNHAAAEHNIADDT